MPVRDTILLSSRVPRSNRKPDTAVRLRSLFSVLVSRPINRGNYNLDLYSRARLCSSGVCGWKRQRYFSFSPRGAKRGYITVLYFVRTIGVSARVPNYVFLRHIPVKKRLELSSKIVKLFFPFRIHPCLRFYTSIMGFVFCNSFALNQKTCGYIEEKKHV